MREIRTFELDDRQAVRWLSTDHQTLQVLRGELWLTVEGHPTDHWLHAGDCIEVHPGELLWLSNWQGAVRFRLSQPLDNRQVGAPSGRLRWASQWVRLPLRRRLAR
ncbi:hypothetical protein ABW99_02920 [Pandoraea thiooxydans]|uniref:DUF2917 domain-containing protein n=1 Tax=Pandoraea thiooxydans TaxID=445709 RepID=A0A0G3EPS0_9BURK|nr:DUF2917 domain-containing protein [Pandoraea thiooxydans]AKJ67337.1 hypothetical protein ABW99_02920 [Pandoraea thiooxydans]